MHSAEVEATGHQVGLDLRAVQTDPNPKHDKVRDPFIEKPLDPLHNLPPPERREALRWLASA